MRIKNVIFDYGGTLDTGGTHWADIIFNAYHRHGINVTEENFTKAYIIAEKALSKYNLIKPSDTFKKILFAKIRIQMEWLYDHGCVSLSIPQLKVCHKAIVDELYRFAKQNTRNARNVISVIKSSGMNVALVSNFYGNIRTVLGEMGLLDSFDCIVESAEVGIRKPDPRIYALAGEKMGVQAGQEDSVVVVGDSLEKDIIPANSLGYRTVWIRPSESTNKGLFDKALTHTIANSPFITPNKTITNIQQLLLFIDTINI